MQGITRSGYQFDIDDRILSDWRFTVALTKCQKMKDQFEGLEGIQEMVRLLFGNKYEDFLKFISDKNDGYVPAEVIMAEVQDIFESKIPKN
jgi:hypothetical protein